MQPAEAATVTETLGDYLKGVGYQHRCWQLGDYVSPEIHTLIPSTFQSVLFQMESDGGDEEAELNILQGFDDSTWLLTSPIKSPGAGLM